MRQASRKLLRELGILDLAKSLSGPTPQDCHALIEIANAPGITVSKLAELLVLSVSAASRLVNSMAENCFIEFRDSIDKRQKSLFLTRHVKALTLSTSRPLRRQIVAMVENIQKNEFHIPVTDDVNSCVHRAEEEFYNNNSYNFWYAVDDAGVIIGWIGLKKIDAKNAEMKKLFVVKPYRGKGVVQKLLEALLKAASKNGFKKLWLGRLPNLPEHNNFTTSAALTKLQKMNFLTVFKSAILTRSFFRPQLLLLT